MDSELLKSACSGESRRGVEDALLMLFGVEYPEMIVTVMSAVIGEVLDRVERRDKPRAFKKAAKKLEAAVADAVRTIAQYDGGRWAQTGESAFTLLINGGPFAHVELVGDVWSWRLEGADELHPARSQLDARWAAETAGMTLRGANEAIVLGAELPSAYVIVPSSADDDEGDGACEILPFARDVRNA